MPGGRLKPGGLFPAVGEVGGGVDPQVPVAQGAVRCGRPRVPYAEHTRGGGRAVGTCW